jgi:hypothetical protein
MTIHKKRIIEHATPEWGSSPFFNRDGRGMRVLLSNWIIEQRESETLNKKRKKKGTLLLNLFSSSSIWLFRLEQWRWQRVSAGPPVSQHARRARPLIRRSEHGSSSRFILQRHRFLSADCPS